MPRHALFTLISVASLSASSALAGGAPEPEKTRPLPPVTDTACGAETHQSLIGKIWSSDLLAGFDGKVRVLEKDSVATMDYLFNRLNVLLDEDGRVEALTCG